jgi:hypothetical protein
MTERDGKPPELQGTRGFFVVSLLLDASERHLVNFAAAMRQRLSQPSALKSK